MCLVAFGSFAMGEAREGSDIDVLAVTRGAGENAQQVESLGHWSEVASSISGNPVNLIRITEVELPKLIKRGSFWRSLSKGVVLIVGTPPPQVKVIG
jgi:predicted nucleotidyltransferase